MSTEPAYTVADPRLKLIKRFEDRFLPKGVLRDRWKVIRAKWFADAEHTGVTLEELKALKVDWRTARESKTRPRPAKAKV
ncbi:MAG: hypothetical protein WCJ40_12020 [Planctomycetota bacterium]